MLDASAFEVAGFDPIAKAAENSELTLSKAALDEGVAHTASGSLTLAACVVCHETFGECAIKSAQAAAMSPALALTICNSMQRMTARAFEARANTPAGYITYVLLGAGHNRASREADLESLAETMR